MIVTSVTLFCSIATASISLMCMNRNTQAGRYECFTQSQNRKAVESGNTAFEESPVPINEPLPFTSSIPETSMILNIKKLLHACIACVLNVWFKRMSLNNLEYHTYLSDEELNVNNRKSLQVHSFDSCL